MARDNKALRLRSIADKLESIASALKADLDQNALFPNEREDLGGYAFADDDVNVALADAAASVSSHELMQMADQAREIYRGRRLRAQILGDDGLFGEPAWDLLLDLFIAEVEGKRLSVTAACIGAAVPTSTALRWIVILESRGLVRRENDPADARRVFLHLTEDGLRRLTTYFLQLHRETITI